MNTPYTSNHSKNFALRWLLLFTCSVMIFSAVCFALPPVTQTGLYDGFIRLHILADSDSVEDQAVKLLVRDAVIKLMAGLTEGCSNVTEAQEVFTSNMNGIIETSVDVLRENGFEYGVSVFIDDEYYPTRIYETQDGEVTLPAGIYRSARIVLGEGEGQNWWCILFPPLCTDSAKAKDKLAAAGFTQNQIRILTDGDNVKYRLKFRSLEIIEELLSIFKKGG